MNLSTFLCPTRVYMGEDSHLKLAEVLAAQGCDRVFVAVDSAVRESELMRSVQHLLETTAVRFNLYSDIEADPSADTVERAFEVCREIDAQAVLAIGGGSTIDVAKAVAILGTNGGRIHDYEGIEKFATRPLTRIVIPTTAGTGSEVSGSCVITDTARNAKMSIRHAAFNPADVALLDPLAVSTVPAHVASHSGLDAFVHAFESYISRGANPITDALNLHALELISGNIRQFVANRADSSSAMAMLSGSALAGMAFGITGLGNVHCMARFVGAFCHVSHGLSNAVCLPHVARFNLQSSPDRYARVAKAMGCQVENSSVLDAANAAVDAIDQLCADLGIPRRLSQIGALESQLEEMAELCVEANYNRWNPRHTTLGDFNTLFREAF
ncbi:MAG: iron-containing alcohol dehydrogenase [Polaromonas sp.]|nr:iron-containing alcohol dehydrogenase [Polaromonas sp.]